MTRYLDDFADNVKNLDLKFDSGTSFDEEPFVSNAPIAAPISLECDEDIYINNFDLFSENKESQKLQSDIHATASSVKYLYKQTNKDRILLWKSSNDYDFDIDVQQCCGKTKKTQMLFREKANNTTLPLILKRSSYQLRTTFPPDINCKSFKLRLNGVEDGVSVRTSAIKKNELNIFFYLNRTMPLISFKREKDFYFKFKLSVKTDNIVCPKILFKSKKIFIRDQISGAVKQALHIDENNIVTTKDAKRIYSRYEKRNVQLVKFPNRKKEKEGSINIKTKSKSHLKAVEPPSSSTSHNQTNDSKRRSTLENLLAPALKKQKLTHTKEPAPILPQQIEKQENLNNGFSIESQLEDNVFFDDNSILQDFFD